MEAAVAQHQRVCTKRQEFELVLDLPAALRLVDELAATQVHLQLRQQVASTLITLTHTHTQKTHFRAKQEVNHTSMC